MKISIHALWSVLISNVQFYKFKENIWIIMINMGRSPNYGRNSNILIPDPYH
jgi:hypothetical protein